MHSVIAGIYFTRGERAFGAGRYPEAKKHYEDVIKFGIDSDTGCMAAIELAVEARDKMREIDNMLPRMGMEAFEQGKYSRARRLFDKIAGDQAGSESIPGISPAMMLAITECREVMIEREMPLQKSWLAQWMGRLRRHD